MATSTATRRPTSPNGSPRSPSTAAISPASPLTDTAVPRLIDIAIVRTTFRFTARRASVTLITFVTINANAARSDASMRSSTFVTTAAIIATTATITTPERARRTGGAASSDAITLKSPWPRQLTFELRGRQHEQHIAGPEHDGAELAGQVVVVATDRQHGGVVAGTEPGLAQRAAGQFGTLRHHRFEQPGIGAVAGAHQVCVLGARESADLEQVDDVDHVTGEVAEVTGVQHRAGAHRAPRCPPVRPRRGTRPGGVGVRRHRRSGRRAGRRRRRAVRSCTAGWRQLRSASTVRR